VGGGKFGSYLSLIPFLMRNSPISFSTRIETMNYSIINPSELLGEALRAFGASQYEDEKRITYIDKYFKDVAKVQVPTLRF
jgi:hypothetical protein